MAMTLTSASDKRGFTLLEILLVVSIMAMAALLVVPSVTGMDNRRFDAQVREASGLLNYARRTAVVRGLPTRVSFHTEEDGSGDASDGNAEDDSGSRPGPLRAGRWVADGIRLGFRDSTGQQREIDGELDIMFYPEGGSTGGELLLSRNGRRAEINIDPFSGRVNTERPDE